MKSIRDLAGVCTLAVLLAPEIAGAIELDDPINFQVIQTWTGTTVGVPGRLGAMLFSQDGQTLYVVEIDQQGDEGSPGTDSGYSTPNCLRSLTPEAMWSRGPLG